MMKLKKIPSGEFIGYIDLNAAKAYPAKIFKSVGDVKFAYSTKESDENPKLGIKRIRTNSSENMKDRESEVVFYVIGEYHVERPLYAVSNPMEWSSWAEIILSSDQLNDLIEALKKCKGMMN